MNGPAAWGRPRGNETDNRMQSSRVWSLTAVAACLGLLIGAWLVRDPQRDGDAIRSALNATLVLRHAENGAFLGSGTLWRRGDVALTNAHVVAGQDRLQVVTRDGERVMARVTARDSDRDIAMLRLDTRLDGGLKPGDAPATGDAIFATGAPLQTEFTATRGIISSTGRQVLPSVPVLYLQHDAAINPGSSGGPLVDRSGRLIGLNSRIADGSRYFVGISYAIPADILDTFAEGDLPALPDLGLALRPIDAGIARALAVPEGRGLLIDDVAPGGAAAQAGLEPGDILLQAEGNTLDQPGTLSMTLAEAGDSARLDIARGEQQLSIDLPLTPKPQADTIQTAQRAAQTPRPIAEFGVTLAADGTVDQIDETGAAYAAGLAQGDVIEAIGGVPFTDPDFSVAPPALLRLRRGDSHLHILLDPSRRTMRPLGGANALDPDVTLF